MIDYFTLNLIAIGTTALFILAGTLFIGRKLDALSQTMERRNQTTACAKPNCKKKTKGLLRGND